MYAIRSYYAGISWVGRAIPRVIRMALYKHYGEKGYDTWVLSRNYLHNESRKYQDNIEADSLLTLNYNSDEIENKFRYERTSRYDNGLKVNWA